jgi:hypothetical protein
MRLIRVSPPGKIPALSCQLYLLTTPYGEDEGSFMARTHVVSSRLQPGQQQRLARKAKQLGRTPSEIGALLIEEGLRRDEFAFIDFRDSPTGRQACLQGSTLAVWEVVWIAQGLP